MKCLFFVSSGNFYRQNRLFTQLMWIFHFLTIAGRNTFLIFYLLYSISVSEKHKSGKKLRIVLSCVDVILGSQQISFSNAISNNSSHSTKITISDSVVSISELKYSIASNKPLNSKKKSKFATPFCVVCNATVKKIVEIKN